MKTIKEFGTIKFYVSLFISVNLSPVKKINSILIYVLFVNEYMQFSFLYNAEPFTYKPMSKQFFDASDIMSGEIKIYINKKKGE